MSVEYYDFDGMRIAYSATGRPGGHPLVFLHNAGASRHLWAPQIDRFAGDREVFALDLFGYGGSDVPEFGYTLRRYRELVTSFVADRVPTGPILVGNCLGSAVILQLLLDPDTNDDAALVLAGAVLINPLTAQTASRGRYGRLIGPAGKVPRVARDWVRRRGLPARVARQVVGEWFTDGSLPDRSSAAQLMVEQLREPGRLAALSEMIADRSALALPDGRGLPESAPPVCTIWGADNVILSAEAGRVLNRTLRPARAEWLRDCGHAAMLERPDEVSAIIDDFISTDVAHSARAEQ